MIWGIITSWLIILSVGHLPKYWKCTNKFKTKDNASKIVKKM